MALSTNDQSSIREYLLGQLSDDEQQKIEERLMLEDELFQEFELSKGELIEEYTAGELGSRESKYFEEHFLSSVEGREQYTFALAFDCLKPPAPAPQPLSWFERLKNLLRTQRLTMALAASAATVLVIIGGLQIFQLGSPTSDMYLTLNNSAVKRDQGALPPKVAIPANTGELKVKLMLPASPTPAAGYRAELDDRDQTRDVRVVESDAQSVTVAIPAEQLRRGEFALNLYMIKADGSAQAIPGSYLFNVE